LFDHFDDEEFKKAEAVSSDEEYRNEDVGLRSASKLPIFIDIKFCRPIFYTTITTSACRRLFVYNHNN